MGDQWLYNARADKESSQIVEEILQALHKFQQGATVEDDVTLIVIKVTRNL